MCRPKLKPTPKKSYGKICLDICLPIDPEDKGGAFKESLVDINLASKKTHLRFGPTSEYPEYGSSAVYYAYHRKINNFKGYLTEVVSEENLDDTTNFFREDFRANTKKNYKNADNTKIN